MNKTDAYKIGQVIGSIIFAVCAGVVIGFGIVYWQWVLFGVVITVFVVIFVKHHIEFNNKLENDDGES